MGQLKEPGKDTGRHGSCRNLINSLRVLSKKQRKMSDRTWGGILFNLVLVVVFISLFTAIMHSKNLNKSLSEDIQQAQVDFQVYKDKAELCFKQLDTKVADIGAKDKQISDLTNNVNKITEEKKGVDAKVAELTAQLDKANKDLAAAKAAPKPEEKEEKEEPKKEEPKEEKKEEAATEAPKF